MPLSEPGDIVRFSKVSNAQIPDVEVSGKIGLNETFDSNKFPKLIKLKDV